MPSMDDDGEFQDFLSKVDDINATIKGLKDGTIDVDVLNKKEEKLLKAQKEKEAKREAAKKAAEEKAAAAAAERKRREEFREQNREKLEELKQDYYLRKARRERWEQFREENKSRAFSDYYKGWDLFEEDPDEELFNDASNPAAVQDQSAFDAMAKDIEERTKQRVASKEACDKERDRGNVAFKAAQYSEALACYSRAIEHFKGDKAAHANRAACHIKLRNFLSALDDCNRVVDIAKFLDDDHERRPVPPPVLKAYVRRAAAHSELGKYEEAAEDLSTALSMAPEAEVPEIRRQQKVLQEESDAAKAEAAMEAGSAAGATAETRAKVRELLQVAKGAADECVDDLTELFESIAALEASEAAGGSGAAEARARAANAALARSKSEAKASAALTELGNLVRDSAACRICVRQAGGVKLLLGLLADATTTPAAAAAPASSSAAAPPPMRHRAERRGAAARSLWAMAIAKVLCLICLERRTQAELHVRRHHAAARASSGASSPSTPRARVVAAAATPSSSSSAPSRRAPRRRARRSRRSCGCSRCARRTRRSRPSSAVSPPVRAPSSASSSLLEPPATADGRLVVARRRSSSPRRRRWRRRRRRRAGAARRVGALLASLSAGAGAKAKQFMVPHARRLCATLSKHLVAGHLAGRRAGGDVPRQPLDAPGLPQGDGRRLEGAARAAAGPAERPPRRGGVHPPPQRPRRPPQLLAPARRDRLHHHGGDGARAACRGWRGCPRSRGARRRSSPSARRASPRSSTRSSRHPSALPGLVKAIVSEGAAHDADADDAPRVVDVTDDGRRRRPRRGGRRGGAADALSEEEEEMVGSAVRILTACASSQGGRGAPSASTAGCPRSSSCSGAPTTACAATRRCASRSAPRRSAALPCSPCSPWCRRCWTSRTTARARRRRTRPSRWGASRRTRAACRRSATTTASRSSRAR